MTAWDDMEPWEQVAAKLADTGLTDDDARAWVLQVLDIARADERETIAQAIEARRLAWDEAWRTLAQSGAAVGPGTVRVAYTESAQIARKRRPG